MSQADSESRIDYIEFGATDIEQTRSFYHAVFGWVFTDYGPGYTSFHDGRLAGGFTTEARPGGGALVVVYSRDHEGALEKVKASGGHRHRVAAGPE